jgi:hypothetical protein
LNYAVALAQSQSTNEAAAESQIRDANLAQEAANLTKAQILVQAGTAALSQANSAPQAILSNVSEQRPVRVRRLPHRLMANVYHPGNMTESLLSYGILIPHRL